MMIRTIQNSNYRNYRKVIREIRIHNRYITRIENARFGKI